MKNVKNFLKSFLILLTVGLNNSCSSFGMAQKQCVPAPVEIPVKPLEFVCVPNERGDSDCYNPITRAWERINVMNYACMSPVVYMQKEKWIRDVLKACNANLL